MSVPVNEQETTIQFDRAGDKANIFTSDSTVMTKLDKLVENSDIWECSGEVMDMNGYLFGKEYRCPKNMISFRSKKKSMPELTEEEKQKKAELLRRNTENRVFKSLEDN